MHEYPFLTFTGKCIPHIKGHTDDARSRHLTLPCPSCGHVPAATQTPLVRFPPDDTEHVFGSTSAIADARHDICASARSASLPPPQTRPVRAAGETERTRAAASG